MLAATLKKQLKEEKPLKNVDDDDINKMIAGLGDKRGLIRRTFAEALGAAGPVTLPALKEALLNHPNVTVRRASAKTLKLVGDPSALPELLEALINDPDPVVQGSSAGAMAIFGEAAVELLEKVLSNPQSSAMQCGLASWGLGFAGTEAPKALLKAASSDNSRVRSAAIAALGDQINRLDDEDAWNLLFTALEDPISDVRVEATILLGRLNDPQKAHRLLLVQLKDKNPQVRKSAAISLMRLQILDAINPLIIQREAETAKEVIAVFDLAIQKLKRILSKDLNP